MNDIVRYEFVIKFESICFRINFIKQRTRSSKIRTMYFQIEIKGQMAWMCEPEVQCMSWKWGEWLVT
jgi:hypothetical protein